MNSKIYVGNLAYEADNNQLEEVFASYGTVKSARVITDRETGRARGFGFVEMETTEEAQEAIKELDGKEVFGRTLRVNEAKETERKRRPFSTNR